jgi:hypothetical protein
MIISKVAALATSIYLILMRSICHSPIHLTIGTRTGCYLTEQGRSEYDRKILNRHRVLRFKLRYSAQRSVSNGRTALVRLNTYVNDPKKISE